MKHVTRHCAQPLSVSQSHSVPHNCRALVPYRSWCAPQTNLRVNPSARTVKQHGKPKPGRGLCSKSVASAASVGNGTGPPLGLDGFAFAASSPSGGAGLDPNQMKHIANEAVAATAQVLEAIKQLGQAQLPLPQAGCGAAPGSAAAAAHPGCG